jgi:hypothetical protein
MNKKLLELKKQQDETSKSKWTKKELKLLDDCMELGLYPSTIAKNKLLPNRTVAAIANMLTMRRQNG